MESATGRAYTKGMSEAHYLREVLILLLAALIAVPLSQRLRFGPVLGYLVAGAVVGPFGLHLIGDIDATRSLADLGVVFLLFTIGLEMTFERLKSIGLMVYGLGLSQILVTAVVIGAIVAASGYTVAAAITVGGALAMSSTAIVLQVLAERGQAKTKFGRTVLAILLLQDLAVGPLLVLLAVLGRDGGQITASLWLHLGLAALKAAAAILVILAAGRLMLRPLLRVVAGARSPELFAASTLLVALGTSWATEQMGLSMAFGAFLAGLLLAETEYRHQVTADIEPFRGVLLGLFFMTVGMGIDVRLAVDRAGPLVGLVGALLLGKTLLLALIARGFRMSLWRGLRLGGMLAQGGEFAFVLLGIAMTSGVVPVALGSLLLLVVALSMATTPLFVAVGAKALTHFENRETVRETRLQAASDELAQHVVIIGFGEVGRIVARMLKAYGVAYVVLDLDPRRIMEGRVEGEPVFYGDAGLLSVLKAAGADRARSAVVATSEPPMTLRIVETIRQGFPTLPVFARGGDERSAVALRKAGITDAIPETMEVGLRLAGAVLHSDAEDDGTGKATM